MNTTSQTSKWTLLNSRIGLTVLLILVFFINWLETMIETKVIEATGAGLEWRQRLAYAASKTEGFFSFEQHDLTNMAAVFGYSISYYFGLPLLAIALAVALARRPELSPYRVLVLSIGFAYWISLPFFLLFPLPERWFYPPSEAVLLSDLWTSALIEALRPVSGMDNSFPSFHSSMSVLLIVVAFQFNVRLRYSVMFLGSTIVLATFVLGIHFIPDILAGVILGFLSVFLALRVDQGLGPAPVFLPATADPPPDSDSNQERDNDGMSQDYRDVFVSYSSLDRERALLLVEAMESEGLTVWWDRELLPGESFRDKIKRQLDACQCVVVLWSENSILSEFVIDEVSNAHEEDRLVPVFIDEVKPPMGFGSTQAGNLIHWNGSREDPDFKKVLQSVYKMHPSAYREDTHSITDVTGRSRVALEGMPRRIREPSYAPSHLDRTSIWLIALSFFIPFVLLASGHLIVRFF